jgi:hypothetical protein
VQTRQSVAAKKRRESRWSRPPGKSSNASRAAYSSGGSAAAVSRLPHVSR